MNFPPFWAKGSHQNFSCWRWSQRSLSEAEALAKEAALKLAERFASGGGRLNRYAYGDRPLREPVLRELKSNSGDVVAVITRNACGCLVLNAARVMFVDVDLAQPRGSGSAGVWLARLLGRPQPATPNNVQDEALAKADAWIRAHPDWGWRIYRTRAGLRLLATHGLFDPAAVSAEPVFDELGADPLYRQLCKTQNCFRARLTPKPWRCGVRHPPSRWPWPDAKAETRFNQWEVRYLKACGERATCELLATMGNAQLGPDIQLIISIHDEATRAESKLALA